MAALRARLPVPIKKLSWNFKYGLLGYPRFVAPSDVVEYLSTRLSTRASVLDFGAGRGSLLRALREKGWTGHFCGVEISRKAVKCALKLADQRSTWIISDIEGFRSSLKWDVITFVESIYYINIRELPEVLCRMFAMLEPNGFILIRIHSLQKYNDCLEVIRRVSVVCENVGPNLLRISNSSAVLA